MNAWLILTLLFLILLAAGAVYFIIYYQIFGTVIVAPSIVGPLNGFCIEVNGSYHSIGSAIKAAEKTIQTTAPSVWKVVQFCMGVYYDNPQKVAAAQCRARICFVISVPTASLESSEEYKTLMKTLSAYSFTLPSTPSLIWHYPYKNWLSFPIGAYKFYSTLIKTHPDLEKKACDVGLQGSLELYRLDVTPPYILFAVPTVIDATLAKQVPLFKAYDIKKAQ